MSATVTSKGQITIPKEVREKLNLQTGDRLEFLVQEDGTAKVVPLTSSVTKLKGMVAKPKKPVSLESMDKASAILISNAPLALDTYSFAS